MLLKDKVVIVSGIGPGLGVELALLAASEGARIAICARTASKLDDAEQQVKALGLDTEILKVPTDISDRAQCQALIEQTIARFGRVDVLINSAYVGGKFEPIETADLEDWKATMDINFFGTMALTQAVIPEMKRTGGGSIVMINTMVTRVPLPWQGGYGASKGALKVATAHLAKEMGVHGIRVNSAFMGWMWGPPVEGYLKGAAKQQGTTVEALRKEIGKNIPLGDIPDDADCARVAIFLASDYSRAMTGACLDVNGGEYLPS
ncbi:MAG: SDR family oxidoreductase [Pseudomonadales bacterium]|nr:SDR family oxidoreductase [Pseudomonadales bacterium]